MFAELRTTLPCRFLGRIGLVISPNDHFAIILPYSHDKSRSTDKRVFFCCPAASYIEAYNEMPMPTEVD